MNRLVLFVFLLGCTSCERPARMQSSATKMELGRQIYRKNCQACHGENGAGIPEQFPTLLRGPWVTGNSKPLIALVLDGMKGEVLIEGVTYRGIMPAWRDSLGDREIAAVLTFIRASWDNHAPEVEAADVQRLRRETFARKSFWTPSELTSLPP